MFFLLSLNAFAQNWDWAVPVGGSEGDELNGLTVDMQGNSYVSGTFRGELSLGGNSVSSIGERDVFVTKIDGDGFVQWVRRGGSNDDDNNGGIAVDSDGNLFTTGRYWDEADFGTLTIEQENGSNSALYVVKYNNSGTSMAAVSIDGSGIKVAADIETDPTGNVYVTGYFGSTLYVENEIINAGGDTDVFTIKFTNDLDLEWVQTTGSLRDVRGISVTTDLNGAVYTTGNFEGEFDFAGETISTNTVDDDGFLLKYDESGNEDWAIKMGGVLDESFRSVATDATGNIYLTGHFIGVLNFAPFQIESPGFNEQIFLAKLDENGVGQWARSIGASNNEFAEDIKVDGNRIVMAGHFSNTTDLEGITLSTDPVRTDGFMAQFDLLGNIQFAKQIGKTDFFDLATRIAIIPGGDPFVAGIFELSSEFDQTAINAFGGYDAFVARLRTTTSVEEPNSTVALNDLKVFPNPFTDQITISTGFQLASGATISVYDIYGRIVFRTNWTRAEMVLDVRDWAKGVYFIEFRNESAIRTEKIVRQ